MNYDISIDHKNKIVLCASEGELTMKSAALMTRDARKQAFELGYNTFHDVTNVSLSVGILDAYSFPRAMENIYEDSRHRSGRAAIIYAPDKDRVFWEFFESTARNAGVDVMVFCNKEEAVQWLSMTRPANKPDADDDK